MRAPDTAEWVGSRCACGHGGGARLKHYELMRCKCGKFEWALRPRRDGPLEAFPWPGPPKTREEMERLEASENLGTGDQNNT